MRSQEGGLTAPDPPRPLARAGTTHPPEITMTDITMTAYHKTTALLSALGGPDKFTTLPDDHPLRVRAVLGKSLGLLWLQGKASRSQGMCRYATLDDTTDGTIRCAVGVLIEPVYYDAVFENRGVDHPDFRELEMALVASRVGHRAITAPMRRMLAAVQLVHDCAPLFTAEFRDHLVDWPIRAAEREGKGYSTIAARCLLPWARAVRELVPDGATVDTTPEAVYFITAVASLSHLLLQAERSVRALGKGTTACCYTNTRGLHCAVGALIRPGLPGNMPGYDPTNHANITIPALRHDAPTVDSDGRAALREALQASGLRLDNDGLAVLGELQAVHDGTAEHTPYNLLAAALRAGHSDAIKRALVWLADGVIDPAPTAPTTREA